MPWGNINSLLKTAVREDRKEKIRHENWRGKLLRARWYDKELNLEGCFTWLTSWEGAPNSTIAGMIELYELLTPTKLYTTRETRTTQGDDVRFCFLKSSRTGRFSTPVVFHVWSRSPYTSHQRQRVRRRWAPAAEQSGCWIPHSQGEDINSGGDEFSVGWK